MSKPGKWSTGFGLGMRITEQRFRKVLESSFRIQNIESFSGITG